MKGKPKAVICLETGKAYNSVREAASSIEASQASIYYALNTGGTTKGYHWRYLDEARAVPIRRDKRCKKVMCLETLEVFETCKDAAKTIGRSQSCISSAIARNGTAGGYHWKVVDDEERIG